MILQKIINEKKEELSSIKVTTKLEPAKCNFKACLKGRNNIIAEIKRSSPSEGNLIQEQIDTIKIGKIFDRYANAISIVTDKKFFKGNLDDIRSVKKVTALPILRKDFIIDEKQVLESRFYGADAILLIASILTKEEIDKFIFTAKKYGMDCLVEVHNGPELSKVLETNADIIGINNRNLENFSIDLNTTKKLAKMIPDGKIIISESGFNNIKDILSANANGVLIGTSIMKSNNMERSMKELRKPKVKICGITNKEDAQNAIRFGADLIGFNFFRDSPRYIDPNDAAKIIDYMPNTVAIVGVFVNEKKAIIDAIAKQCRLDYIQLHGNESNDFCNSFSLPIIKGFNVMDGMPPIFGYNIFGYLFDSYSKGHYGGTGKTFDISLIKNFDKKLFVSGGLNCDNVKNVIANLDPYCIDVCSGVEKEKGIKDAKKMKRFIDLVKNYDK